MAAQKNSDSKQLAVDDGYDFLDREYDRVIASKVGGRLVEDLAAEIVARDMGPASVSVRAVVNPETGEQRIISMDEDGELEAIERANKRPGGLQTTGHRVRRPDREGIGRMLKLRGKP